MASKRGRGRQREDAHEDTDEDVTGRESRMKKQRTRATDHEIHPDSDEDLLYIEESQKMASEFGASRGGVQHADYGTIECVKIENFMCHKALTMTFGPFMNFVVGQNGSGKSAVLSAVTLCLGAKATTTNRGGNVKSFIKEGEHTAIVEVHLKNRGDGFKPDIYGETIIVQRSFNRDGVNSYKIKSKSGKVISTSKKELSDIIDYMSLQVDNPMTVLSQDNARQFLSNASDEEKYKFFMKGVQLDDLYALYQSMKSQQSQIENVLGSKSEDIRELKEDSEAAEKRFKALQETQDLRERVQELLLKHAWSQVLDAETSVGATESGLSESRRKLKDLENDLIKSGDVIAKWEQNLKEAEAAVQSSNNTRNPLKDRQQDLEEQLQASSEKIQKNQWDERMINDHVKTAKGKLEKAKRDLDAESKRLDDADNGRHAALLEEKQALLSEKSRIQEAQLALEENPNNKVAAETAKSDFAQATELLERKKLELQIAEDNLNKLRTNQANDLAAYGDNMARLLKSIERYSWKKQKPIGPIGLHIKLREKAWSSILERQLSRVLNGFVAFCIEDKDKLIQMIKEHRCEQNTVYRSKDGNFQLQEPETNYMTILRALEIEHDDIKKTLVNISNIEQTILVEDHTEAIKIMERRPGNVKFCYSINRNKHGNGFNIKMGQGSGSVDPIIAWTGASRIAMDIKEQMQLARSHVEAAREEFETEKANHQERKRIKDAAENATYEYRRSKQKYSTDLQRIDDRLEDLERDVEKMHPENEKMPQLKIALKLHEESLDTYNGQLKDNANEKERLTLQYNEIQTQIDNLKAEIDESDQQTKGLQGVLNNATRGREQAVMRNSNLLKKIQERTSEIEKMESEVQEKTNSLEEMKIAAEQVGSRIELEKGATTQKIERELEKLNSELEKSDARMGAPSEVIAKEYGEKKERYNAAQQEISGLEKLHGAIDRAFEGRMERWYEFRKRISVQSRMQFHFLMSEREFDGNLAFDHRRGILQIKVQPTQQASDTQRNAKTLSGGEKTFSQICLLLALWEAMGSPFRCLDEFDVFMDPINRGVAMGLIIKAAKNSVGKQFILITPQDVSTKGIDETAEVKIVRMPNPERNQTVLNTSTS